MTTMNTPMYAKSLERFRKGKLEVDLVLMAMLFDVDVKLFYMGEEGLKKQEFSFPGTKAKAKVQLYLGPEGYFDVVCDKAFVKSAGICQSLILDVSL